MVKITTGAIEINEAGLIINNFKTRSGFKPVYILEQAHAVRQLSLDKRLPMLVNISSVDNYSATSVLNLLTADNLSSVSKMAIFMSSEFKCGLINFMLKFKSTNCPVRVFTDFNNADLWLRS
ncbi:MAG: hypothetical protein ACO3EE_03515 [Flavobacteriales bacterium]